VIRRVLLSSGGVLLLLGLALGVAAQAAGDGSASKSVGEFVPTVRCDEVTLYFKRSADVGSDYRLVLGTFAVPPAYLAQTVRDPTSAPFLYSAKAGLAIRASTAVETVSLPNNWRDRARIVWGAPGTPAAAVRFAPCPSPSGSPIAWNGYSGGFMLRAKSACVPLIFAVGHRRATIRFGVGRRC
jgi:hypothetical protein